MTYTAIMTLKTLGDDFSRLHKTSIISGLKTLQQPSGAFSATKEGGECDMRFLYCACAISAALDDWTGELINSYIYLMLLKKLI
jgi:geranylgeranyl transferase type-1 subunit beta